MSQMQIVVNGHERSVPVGCTVDQLLEALDLGGQGLAIAVDRAIVPRSERSSWVLEAGATVEILRAVGGG